jgi:UDP-N-acetyl-2-amino-2-deoxyglucuronate dehydrogenase
MARKMNFGVLGLGMGKHHCKAAIAAKNANLLAVCDLDEARLKQSAKEYDCKPYAKYSDMLKDKDIDAICVATESGNHATHGIQAARAGKHIIMEKPIDVTPARVRKLEDVVAETGVKCGCIFQSRMENCNILLKRAIDKGRLGKMIGVHAWLPWFRADDYYEGAHGSWKGTWKLDGGGSLMNQGIHTIDLLCWLAGPVKSVAGFSGVFNHAIESEDQTVAILKFENGAFGSILTTTCCIPGDDQRLYMYGNKGSFAKYGGTVESCDMGTPKERERILSLFGAKKKKKAGISADPMAVGADGHALIIADLVKAVQKDRDTVIPIASAKHAVEVACAIFKSNRTGKEVQVKDVAK